MGLGSWEGDVSLCFKAAVISEFMKFFGCRLLVNILPGTLETSLCPAPGLLQIFASRVLV